MSNLKEIFQNRYNKLNDRQKKAVDTIYGPVLVVAGPGTGKTELLAIRTGHILNTTDSSASSILLLTFTESAAFNMRERLINLIGEQAYRIGIYTFHSFATDIINKYPDYFFDGAKFYPATEVDQINIIENIVKNLPRKNPFSKFHPEIGYIYVRDIISAIKDLKKSGYTPEKYFEKLKDNKKYLKELSNLCSKLDEISGKKKFDEVFPYYQEILEILEKLKTKNEIANVLFGTLNYAINSSAEERKTTPLTNWKGKYTKKTESGKIILKDCEESKNQKLDALLEIYQEYQNQLYKQMFFDFEDMILMATKAIKENFNLKADLNEKFQFVMIDEFQDTNNAQFNLVKALFGDVESPNILAVGDDDQAIFKFQGAEINNIFDFINNFKDTKTIVLDKNYRSTQNILNFSREVIIKGEDRLENRKKDVIKILSSENKNLLPGEIITKKFENETLEYEFIAKQIQSKIHSGVNPKEIAIICRKHEQLQQVVTVLNSFKIPFSYEKKENVLDKKPIYEIITILKFLNAHIKFTGDEFLPEILSFDFWNLQRLDIWKIAISVKNQNTSWLEAMIASENLQIREIANFLISLSIKSLSTPLEYIIDEIIGTTEFLKSDTEHDDEISFKPTKNPVASFVSPYKKYYFNNHKFQHNKPEYLDFLSSLRTFIQALREFHSNKILLSRDIDEFLNIYNGYNLTLSVVSPFSTSQNAVSVLTVHKSKGLEFEYVFLLSADQNVWKRGGLTNKISFPINMPLTVEGDNDDDKIRLLYVALTRTKHTLYITHNSHKLEYLENDQTKKTETKPDELSEELVSSLHIIPKNIYLQDEKILLKRLLENYKMPVTHLNNFLNFTKVGPSKFIEQNLLRFPQAYSPSAAYGSAMHSAIESFFLSINGGKKPELKYVKSVFEANLKRSRLPEHEFKKYLESGFGNLDLYIKDLQKRKILPDTKVETKFNSEGVMIGQVPATGNIDKIEFLNSEIIVTDLKTGEAIDSWEESGLNDYEKIKLHFFKYQLAFYALLIENSRTFSNYKIKAGNIEFLEADKNQKIIILPFEIKQDLKDRVKKLANIVYQKIQNLDFPSTEKYPENLKGILQFEEDLLNAKI